MASLKRKADVLSGSAADLKKPKKDSSLTSFFGAPKTTSSTTSNGTSSAPVSEAPPPRFNKEDWVATLKPEQRELLQLEIDTLDPSWLAHLKTDVVSPSFLDLKRFLKREIDSGKKIFPPLEDVYSWYGVLPACVIEATDRLYHRSRHTPLNTVRAVILGQDPYHNHNQAHGLCFSVRPPTPAPPSLQNMYKALRKDYPSFKSPPNNGGLLTPWAEQGVLLLNTCLTVRAHEANSHSKKGWEPFTQKVIDLVARVRTRGVVFLAWGTPAQQRCAKIDKKRHLVLQSVHPSPLSAMRGFFDCGHFLKTNEWLESRYGSDGTINWDLNHPKPIAGPKVLGAVKVAGDPEKERGKEGPATEIAQASNEVKGTLKDEFEEEEEDIEAIKALEELANDPATNGIAFDDEAATVDETEGE